MTVRKIWKGSLCTDRGRRMGSRIPSPLLADVLAGQSMKSSLADSPQLGKPGSRSAVAPLRSCQSFACESSVERELRNGQCRNSGPFPWSGSCYGVAGWCPNSGVVCCRNRTSPSSRPRRQLGGEQCLRAPAARKWSWSATSLSSPV